MRGNSRLKKRKPKRECEYKRRANKQAYGKGLESRMGMEDVQHRLHERGIGHQRGGGREVHLPFGSAAEHEGYQQIVRKITAAVNLPEQYRGPPLSRFLEIMVGWGAKPLAGRGLQLILL